MKSLIYWLIAIAIGFYAYYDTTTFEQARTLLSILLAVTLIYANTTIDKVQKLEDLADSREEQIAELSSEVEELKQRFQALEYSILDADLMTKIDAIESRLEAIDS